MNTLRSILAAIVAASLVPVAGASSARQLDPELSVFRPSTVEFASLSEGTTLCFRARTWGRKVAADHPLQGDAEIKDSFGALRVTQEGVFATEIGTHYVPGIPPNETESSGYYSLASGLASYEHGQRNGEHLRAASEDWSDLPTPLWLLSGRMPPIPNVSSTGTREPDPGSPGTVRTTLINGEIGSMIHVRYSPSPARLERLVFQDPEGNTFREIRYGEVFDDGAADLVLPPATEALRVGVPPLNVPQVTGDLAEGVEANDATGEDETLAGSAPFGPFWATLAVLLVAAGIFLRRR